MSSSPAVRMACIARTACIAALGIACGTAVGADGVGSGRLQAVAVGRHVAPDGSLKGRVIVEVDGGKIKAVRPWDGKDPGPGVLVREDAVLSPGLVDLGSQLGASGRSRSTVSAIEPTVSAIDALDLRHPDFRAAARAGITSAMQIPDANNLVSGVAAVVKTVALPGHSPVLEAQGPLVISLGPQVWSDERAPTSRVGSIAMLRDWLAGSGSPEGRRSNGSAARHGAAMVYCAEAMDVSSALRVLGAERSIAVMYTGEEIDLADELSGYSAALIAGPLGPQMSPAILRAPGAWSEAGVPVAFRSGTPSGTAEGLRMSAALAVRYGMQPEAARRAITLAPAMLAGVAQRVGSIHVDRDADLVLFSDDPLRLNARVLEVYIEGVRVFDASVGTDIENDANHNQGVTP